MLRYTKILLILLIVGGCIYVESVQLPLQRTGIEQRNICIRSSNQSYEDKPSQGNGRVGEGVKTQGLHNIQYLGLTQYRKEEHLDSRNINRPSNRDNFSNGNYTTFLVTAYTKNDAGMNGRGITASGKRARVNHTIAASRGIPLHTKIYFPELGFILTVEDRGGHIKGNRIDLYYGTDLKGAKRFGKRKLKGVVLK